MSLKCLSIYLQKSHIYIYFITLKLRDIFTTFVNTLQVLELLYADEDYRIIIILPFEIDGLQGTLGKLNGNTLNNAMNSLVRQEVRLRLPKFKIETTIELIEILKAVSKKICLLYF